MSKGRIQAIFKMSVVFWTWAVGQVGAARRHHREGVWGPALALPCCEASPVSRAGAAHCFHPSACTDWEGIGTVPDRSISGRLYHSDAQTHSLCEGHGITFATLSSRTESLLGGTSPPHSEGSQLCPEGHLPFHSLNCLLPATSALLSAWIEDQPDKITTGKACPVSSAQTFPAPLTRLHSATGWDEPLCGNGRERKSRWFWRSSWAKWLVCLVPPARPRHFSVNDRESISVVPALCYLSPRWSGWYFPAQQAQVPAGRGRTEGSGQLARHCPAPASAPRDRDGGNGDSSSGAWGQRRRALGAAALGTYSTCFAVSACEAGARSYPRSLRAWVFFCVWCCGVAPPPRPCPP